jgi:ribosome biogenesis protein MAK21
MTPYQNIPQEPLWYNISLPELPDYEQAEPLPPFRLAGIQSRVNSLLSDFRSSVTAGTSGGQGKGKGASKNSATFGKSTADAAFLRQVLQDGTHQDKLSALILLVRESPLHRMDELERLRIMAGGKTHDTTEAGSSSYSAVKGAGGGREERIAVLRALADWWVSGGGKEAGKLKYLADQPQLGNPAVTDRHLLVWGFEDWLKKWFFSILQILEVYLADTLPYVKTQAMAVTMKLLAGNAEQEQNLLRLGVNKLVSVGIEYTRIPS